RWPRQCHAVQKTKIRTSLQQCRQLNFDSARMMPIVIIPYHDVGSRRRSNRQIPQFSECQIESLRSDVNYAVVVQISDILLSPIVGAIDDDKFTVWMRLALETVNRALHHGQAVLCYYETGDLILHIGSDRKSV